MVETNEDPGTDIALVARMVARDSGALAELYDRHSRLLFSLILRIVKDRSEAEDVLQEVFLAAWTKAATYKPEVATPVGWLVGVARNRSIDRLRSTGSRQRTIDAAGDVRPAPIAMANPESHVAQTERQRHVARALQALPAEQRTLIEDAYYLGLTQSELAVRFQVPLGTVKTRVRAGMQVLRQQLQESFSSR